MIKRCFLTALILLIATSCSKKQVAEIPPLPVATAIAQAKNIPYYIDTLGHFVAYNTVNIQAQIQGELTAIYFDEGQTVKAGDLLFTIDNRPYLAVYDKSVAILKENEATLAYNLSRQERYSGLVEQDYVSKLQYTQYVTELESQKAIIEANKAEIESAAINVGYCTLYSPINGVTGKRLVDVGNIITDVGSTLLVINQISPLYIDFSVPERHFDAIRQMQNKKDLLIEIYVPNTSLMTNARLQMLDNTINPDTGMIALRGILPNEDERFWPQQFVRVRLIVDTISNAVMVPQEAIVSTSRGEMVWVVNADQTVKVVPVKLGEEYNNEVRIVQGLKAGDQVVTKGQLPLRDGKKVVIKNKDASTS